MLARLVQWYNRYSAWSMMAWALTILALIGSYQLGLADGLIRLVIALIFGTVADFLLHRSHTPDYNKRPTSGAITALIVLLVLPFGITIPVLIATIVFALLSKHFIRLQNRHIFNPAAFGLVAISLLLALSGSGGLKLGWWGETFLIATIILTALVVYRVKKQWQVISFIATYLILLVAINPSALGSANLTSLLLFVPWFFALDMVPEPQTSVPTRRQQVVFGAFVGLLSITFSYLPLLKDVALPAALLGSNLLAMYLRTTRL